MRVGIGAVDIFQETPQHRPAGPTFRELEKRPTAVPMPIDQSSFGHQLEVTADAWLALPEDAREILDVQLSRHEQHKDAQARRLRRGLEHCNC